MQSRLKSRPTTWRTSTRSLKPCKLSVLQHAQLGVWVLMGYFDNLQISKLLRMTELRFRFVNPFARPETQKEILKLCAECTKTDVALNNLVIRARTTTTRFCFLFCSLDKKVFGASPCQHFTRTLKPAAKGASKPKPSKPASSEAAPKRVRKTPKNPKKD